MRIGKKYSKVCRKSQDNNDFNFSQVLDEVYVMYERKVRIKNACIEKFIKITDNLLKLTKRLIYYSQYTILYITV